MRISDWSSDVCSSDLAYGSTQCDAYCVGYQLDNEAHNITYNRVEAHHFQESGTAASKYWNGDGFSDERGNHGIRYLTCTAPECTDGGFDLKSTEDRKSVVSGKRVSVRVDIGGRGVLKQKKNLRDENTIQRTLNNTMRYHST